MALMGGKSGGNSALAAKPNLLSALRVQTSSYGQVVPILYGQNRIASRLIWAGDFTAIPHTSTTKVGGKGLGSGGGNAVTNTTYTYQTAVAMALCQGPILNIHNVWDTAGKLTLITATVAFTVPGGGGGITVTPPGSGLGAGVFHSHLGVSRADLFSFSQNDFGSDGAVAFSGTQQTPMTQVGSAPAAGQFTQSGAVFDFAAADAGKVMTITYVYSVPDSNSNGQPQQKLSLTLFLGSRPQTPWSYLTSAHPGTTVHFLLMRQPRTGWRSKMHSKKPRTIEMYEWYVRNLSKMFAGVLLSQIHIGHFLEYQRKRRMEAGASCVNHELNTLAQILKTADLSRASSREAL